MIFYSLTFARSRGECFNTPRGTKRMFTHDKIMFDCYYSINSVQTKEITVHYILHPHHIFMRVKKFHFINENYACFERNSVTHY